MPDRGLPARLRQLKMGGGPPGSLRKGERFLLDESSGESESVERAVVEPGDSADSATGEGKHDQPVSVCNTHMRVSEIHTECGLAV
jgi:hypothetical protein